MSGKLSGNSPGRLGHGIVSVIAVLAAGTWFIALAQAESPIAPWQEPPTSEAFKAWASQSYADPDAASAETCGCKRGDACGSAGAAGACDDAGCTSDPIFGLCGGWFILPHDEWVRAEALLWWTRGSHIPPLLTTSPDGTSSTQAGVLNQPGTEVLLGNQRLNNDFRAGGRISFGTWLDESDSFGIEFAYLGLGQSTDQFISTSPGSPILARPFFNADTGVEDAHLIAYPNLLQGSFSAVSTSNFQVAECLMRWAIARGCGYRIELLGGYRFQQLAEGLDIADTSSAGAPSSTIQISDQFHTRNDFNGGELGIAIERRLCRWSLESNLKLALGDTHSRIDINGSTTTAAGVFSGGLLALPSNMGAHNADQFSVIPELSMTLGYNLTCHLRATLGYTFIYWSNVSRPGDQIDLNVSPSQFPPPTASSEKPAFVQHTSDFWAQGVNVGLDYRF